METAVHGALERTDHDGLFYWADEVEVDFAVRRGLSIRSLIQVVAEGLEKDTVRTRELRSLKRARTVFPQAEMFLVAGSLPDASPLPEAPREESTTAGPEVRWIPLWRFLTGAGAAARIVEGRLEAAPDPTATTSTKEVVLRHLLRHGRITRREAAELCGLSRPQASRLLGRLVEAGRIVRHGSGGGTWYSPEGPEVG